MYGASELVQLSLPCSAGTRTAERQADHKSSVQALNQALDNLEAMIQAIGEKYDDAVRADDYETFEDEPVDFETVNAKLWAQKEAEGRGTYAEFLERKMAGTSIQSNEGAPVAAPEKAKKSAKSKAR